MPLTRKQKIAWTYLHDKVTTQLLFGGGAGGGKSNLLMKWIATMALSYPQTRYFLGRESLEDLKKSTLLTLFEVLGSTFGLKEANGDFTHNAQDKFVDIYQTGSRIYYSDIKFYPSDPDYEYLGSTEYTAAAIDEASQITGKAKSVIRSRLRYKLDQFGLVPKLGLGTNPHKGYLKQEFYDPWRKGTLPPESKFVQALPTDNPFLSQGYIDELDRLDPATRARLLHGDWDYDDDPSKLCEFDALDDLFTNIVPASADRFIIADIARFGDDRTTVYYFEGWRCQVYVYRGLSIVETAQKIDDLRRRHGVGLSRVLVDEDGVGGGVKDILRCKGFQAASSPLKGDKYLNLKAQCGYMLAKKVNERGIRIETDDPQIREQVVAELDQVLRARDTDKDGKLALVSKDSVKQRLGRSPDLADPLLMRMWFELVPKPGIFVITAGGEG